MHLIALEPDVVIRMTGIYAAVIKMAAELAELNETGDVTDPLMSFLKDIGESYPSEKHMLLDLTYLAAAASSIPSEPQIKHDA